MAKSTAAGGSKAGPSRVDDSTSSGDSTGTRSVLQEMIKLAGEIDVASLARQLGISGVAVRQHLAALDREGKVTQRTVRRPMGRPARLYRLTEAAEKTFPQSSDQVALDLLARLERLVGSDQVERAFRTRLNDLSGQYAERLAKARSLARKLEILAEIRESEGYLCAIESVPKAAAKGGVRLVEHHCPVSNVADQYPQMCEYELELFRRVLDEPDLQRVEHIRSGGHACRYEVPTRPDKKER